LPGNGRPSITLRTVLSRQVIVKAISSETTEETALQELINKDDFLQEYFTSKDTSSDVFAICKLRSLIDLAEFSTVQEVKMEVKHIRDIAPTPRKCTGTLMYINVPLACVTSAMLVRACCSLIAMSCAKVSNIKCVLKALQKAMKEWHQLDRAEKKASEQQAAANRKRDEDRKRREEAAIGGSGSSAKKIKKFVHADFNDADPKILELVLQDKIPDHVADSNI